MSPDRETVLREILSTIEPPASGITAAGLLQEGRRARRRRRQWYTASAAGAVTFGLVVTAGLVGRAGTVPSPQAGASTPAAAPGCTAERLALPPNTNEGGVNAASPDGRHLAGAVTGPGNPALPVRWDGTRAVPIPIDGTGEATGVNDSGVAVGRGQTAGHQHYAWAYAGGKVVKLPVPKGYTGAEASAVNAAGQVAGVLFAGEHNAAVVWQSATADAGVTVLDAPGGAMAFGISDEGVVVGSLETGAAYRWDANGRGSKLAGPAGTDGGSGALGVRGDWVYGLLTKSEPSAGDKTAFPGGTVIDPNVAVLWNLATGKAGTVDDGRVEAISPTGQITVNGKDGTASIRQASGESRPLPPLTAGAKAYAYALSDDGTLAGGASADRPVRWSCAAEGNR